MSEHSGRRSPVPFARYDRESSSWRTCLPSLELESLPEPAVTWPRAGISSGGLCWELTRSAHPTAGAGASSWLLPTPTASDRFGPGAHGDGGADLRTTISLLPTPQAHDGRPSSPVLPSADLAARRIAEGRSNLEDSVALLPTPTARDYKGQNQRRDTSCLPGALQCLPGAVTGASTPPPSDGGSAFSDGLLLFPEWPDPEAA